MLTYIYESNFKVKPYFERNVCDEEWTDAAFVIFLKLWVTFLEIYDK